MEDSHTHILSLPDDPDTAFFGVYDGHGGDSVALYAGRHLHKFIVQRKEFQTDVPTAMQKVSATTNYGYVFFFFNKSHARQIGLFGH